MAFKRVYVPIEHEAANKRAGMTFGELKAFVADCERFAVSDDQVIKMVSTWKQSIKELFAKGQVS